MAKLILRALYQGPWLQLPLELLESLLVLNLDPATLSSSETQLPALTYSSQASLGGTQSRPTPRLRDRDRILYSLKDNTPPESPGNTFTILPTPYTPTSQSVAFPLPAPGKATPPPIDPGVFRNVAAIRRLIDEASELSVRASSGLSAAALGSMRTPSGNAWTTAQGLGFDGSNNTGGGRNVAMSAMRVHRLRALAVQKLAAAYKADEIASSVMVMQGGSVFDDIAEKVLKSGMFRRPPSMGFLSERSADAATHTQILMILMHDMCISSMKRFPPGSCNAYMILCLTFKIQF